MLSLRRAAQENAGLPDLLAFSPGCLAVDFDCINPFIAEDNGLTSEAPSKANTATNHGDIALSLVALSENGCAAQRETAEADAVVARSMRKRKKNKEQLFLVKGIKNHRKVTSRTEGEYLIEWESGQPSWEP